jgi:predicted NUDIX family NTP pyrophosphohydrolase
MFRRRGGKLEVLLAHPGGPYWRGKDDASWTIPKGEVAAGEELLDAAQREFEEETGVRPAGPFIPLTAVKQKAGKTVHAWAFAGDCDTACLVSNTYKVEWPPKSGEWQSFPEIDRAEFFEPAMARRKINPAQAAFIDELERLLGAAGPAD